ncbi:MAG: sigma-70 family RNA polymerase sigma factor [Pseudomonadota bacterium]
MPLLPSDHESLKAWLHRTAQKDGNAFRALYDATSAKLYGLALRILGKGELAEEALQESYVKIWKHAAGYEESRSSPMTWMLTIVRNQAFDMLRRANVKPEIDTNAFDDDFMASIENTEPTPADLFQRSQEAQALARCLLTLDALHRQAIALAFFHDLSHCEVATQLKLPIGTVKTWIRRGLTRLQGCLAGREQA